ncbi:MAG: AIR synthase family protein [Candidatus Odinarchaeia archaeon]
MLPRIGKIDRLVFDKVIFPNLGKKDKKVIIGPQHGVDAAAILLDEEKGDVMVVAEDPTFGMPSIMPYFGWAIVHICASDVAILGVQPKYMTISLLLPPGTNVEVLEKIWKQIHEECEKLGITIVGGHTGVYPGINYPLNGGCTVFGFGKKDQLTPPSNAKVGDSIIMTKGPAVEAVGVLAVQAEKELKEKYGTEILEKCKKYLFEMTVVKDALIAAKYANAMHDATEGGLLNAVYEIAEASKVGCILYEDKIFIPEEIDLICKYFNIDPLISISEGTLVITAPPENAEKIISELKENKIDAWIIGEIVKTERTIIRSNGVKEELKPVKVDPFWEAYFRTL